jgi:hypothetical protein
MCCLKYEQEAYEDLIRNSPKAESFVDTVDGRGTVVELDLLRQRVKVKMEDHPEIIGTYANADIAVLRNGKAKKTDPPIPADLAPISGSSRRSKKQQTQSEDKILLDPIRFRYSTETIAEAAEEIAPQPEAEAQQPKEQKRSHHRSRRRPNKQPKPEGAPAAAEAQQPRQNPPKESQPPREEGQGTAAKKNYRRRPPRRRKSPQNTEGK